MSTTTPWYQRFFDEGYLRVYLPFLSPQKTAAEVAQIEALLALPAGSRILDLCCGEGRHTLLLAQAGYELTGLDLSPNLLEQARDAAKQQELDISWVQSDMRTIPFEQEFDAIINIFTSFGYLENEEEDRLVLQQVAQALKPGGLFLLETVYQPKVIRTFSPHSIIRYPDGLIVLEERRLDLVASRNEILTSLLYPDGTRTEYLQSIRIYTLTELARMLTSVGLSIQAYYGNLDQSPLSLDSRLVILCRRT